MRQARRQERMSVDPRPHRSRLRRRRSHMLFFLLHLFIAYSSSGTEISASRDGDGPAATQRRCLRSRARSRVFMRKRILYICECVGVYTLDSLLCVQYLRNPVNPEPTQEAYAMVCGGEGGVGKGTCVFVCAIWWWSCDVVYSLCGAVGILANRRGDDSRRHSDRREIWR